MEKLEFILQKSCAVKLHLF